MKTYDDLMPTGELIAQYQTRWHSVACEISAIFEDDPDVPEAWYCLDAPEYIPAGSWREFCVDFFLDDVRQEDMCARFLEQVTVTREIDNE